MCDETSNQGSCIAACTMFPLPLVTNYSLKWLNSRLYTWHTRRELYGLGQTARAARRRYMNSYITVALWSCRARLLCAARGGSVSRAGNRRGHSNDSTRESQKAGQPEYWPSSRSRQSSANRNKNFSVRPGRGIYFYGWHEAVRKRVANFSSTSDLHHLRTNDEDRCILAQFICTQGLSRALFLSVTSYVHRSSEL